MNTSTGPRAGLWRKVGPSVVISAVVPLVVYTWLRPHTGSDATALLVAAAVPTAFTLGKLAVRRRLDPIGLVAVCCFAVAALVFFATGGNTVVLKLHEAVVTGPLGLVCLASVAIGKPLHQVVLRLVARRSPGMDRPLDTPGSRRASNTITGIVGATLVLHALVLLALAVSLPTQTYLEVSRPIGLAVIAVGVGSLFWYRNHGQGALATTRRAGR
ncbi:VC0807 family protein [Actinophytocola oryzae]|uniref:Intracellular septation protein A n=1 Tax=Actinophytocola oryzae TaxID=502181 RepID=A0A4V3FU87_9PSEU|nr:VC0807 family protein [Actinophytocola oryzae]TDV54251.1 hypothetical protein CLV71_104722 [Actinophytocola oryzae]